MSFFLVLMVCSSDVQSKHQHMVNAGMLLSTQTSREVAALLTGLKVPCGHNQAWCLYLTRSLARDTAQHPCVFPFPALARMVCVAYDPVAWAAPAPGMSSSCTHWWSCAAGHWCQCRYSPCLHGCQPAHLPPAPSGCIFPSGSLPSLNVNFCSFNFHLHLTYVAFIPGDRHQWHQ